MSSQWNLSFITKDDFREHVYKTVQRYRSNMQPYDLNRLNRNTLDPIKLLLDKSIYGLDWDGLLAMEIGRQRDKGNNNGIGYFHQNIFGYIDGCEVPHEGWDVIYRNPGGIDIGDGTRVSTVYVEMKNKHNTMNAASSAKTYLKAQDQLLADDDCACFLVEAIAKESQDIPWEASVDGEKKRHRLIRRVSMDRFYEIVTGDPFAFAKVCNALSSMVDEVAQETSSESAAPDTATADFRALADTLGGENQALFSLGFGSYKGFRGFSESDLRE